MSISFFSLLLPFLFAFPATGWGEECLASGCHAGLLALGELHPPVAEGNCLVCHQPVAQGHPSAGGGEKLSRTEIEELCFQCHPALAEAKNGATSIHDPVREQPCTSCHDPHGGPKADLLPAAPPTFCVECHDDIGERMTMARSRHAVLYRQESCAACHLSHYAREPHLLSRPQRALCLSCHGKDDYTTSAPLRNIATEVTERKFLHGPVADGECAPCHDPHGSASFRLLKGEYPAGFYAPFRPGLYDFCLQCHDRSLLAADSPAATRFRDGDLNLHSVHVTDPRKGRSCRACHEPHGADNAALISTEGTAFGDWTIPIGFQRSETGGSCAPGCHPKKAYDRRKPAADL